MDGQPERLAFGEAIAQRRLVFLRIEGEGAGGNPRREQISDGAAAPDARGIDVIHHLIAFVPNEQMIVGIEHAKALHHVIDGELRAIVVDLPVGFRLTAPSFPAPVRSYGEGSR